MPISSEISREHRGKATFAHISILIGYLKEELSKPGKNERFERDLHEAIISLERLKAYF